MYTQIYWQQNKKEIHIVITVLISVLMPTGGIYNCLLLLLILLPFPLASTSACCDSLPGGVAQTFNPE